MSTGALPDLGVRVDALGVEQAQAKIRAFGQTVGRLPRDLDQTSRAAKRVEVNFQKMSFAMFGASLAITGTVTSLSRLEKSALAVQRASVALERGQDLVTRKQAALNRILVSGERFTGDLALAQSELATAISDVTVKEEDLLIKTGEVSDTYINFAASLGSSVLFAVVAFTSAIDTATKASIRAKLSTGAHLVSVNLLRASVIQTSPAIVGMTTATQASTIALIKATFATQGLTAALRVLLAHIGPVGWALLAVGTVLTLVFSGVLDFIPGVAKLRGVTEDLTEATVDSAEALDEFNLALTGDKGGIKSITSYLPSLTSTRIQMESLAVATGMAAVNMEKLGAAQVAVSTAPGGGGVGGRQQTITDPATGKQITITIPNLPGAGDFIGPQRIPSKIDFIQGTNINTYIQRLQQVQQFEDDTRRTLEIVLDLTKSKTEEAQRAIGLEFIKANFAEGEIGKAQQVLSLLISQNRERDKAIDKAKEFREVNPLFDILFRQGLVGQPGGTVFGRGAGGIAQRGGASFGTGQLDRFLGFIGQPITVGGQTFQSRVNNPAFGQTLGGQATNAANTFTAKSGGNFAASNFATGGVGPGGPGRGNRISFGPEQLQFQIFQSILGGPVARFSQSQARTAEIFNISADLAPIMLANQLGLIDGPAILASGIGIKGAIAVSNDLIGQLTAGLKRAAAELDIEQREFGADIFGFRPGAKRIKRNIVRLEDRIGTAAEFKAEIARISEIAERRAFIAEAERRIDRELRFRLQQVEQPGTNLGAGGTQLFMDIQPLADALVAILSGEDHKQFISLLGDFKFR